MKIVADLSRVIPGRISLSSVLSPRERLETQASQGYSSRGEISRGPSGANNRFMEALSIAQMAQNVLNNAIVISSRLRNIAQEALAHRKINYEELATAGAQLNSTLGEFANRYSALIIPPPIQSALKEGNGAAFQRVSDREPLPLREYAALINNAIGGIREGGMPDVKALEEAMGLMQQNADRVRVLIDVMTRADLVAEPAYGMPGGTARTVREASAGITGDFNTALAAQGNLRREHVAVLLGD